VVPIHATYSRSDCKEEALLPPESTPLRLFRPRRSFIDFPLSNNALVIAMQLSVLEMESEHGDDASE